MFKKLFYKVLSEDITAGSGGALGDYTSTGGALQAKDTYNPGDYRMHTGGKKKKNVKENIPMMRRSFPETLTIQRRSLTNNRLNTSRM